MSGTLIKRQNRAASPVVGVVLMVGLVTVVASTVAYTAFSYSDKPKSHVEDFEEVLDSAQEIEESSEVKLDTYDVELTGVRIGTYGHSYVGYDIQIGPTAENKVKNINKIIVEVPEDNDELAAQTMTERFTHAKIERNGREVGVDKIESFGSRRDESTWNNNIAPVEGWVVTLSENITVGPDSNIRIHDNDNDANQFYSHEIVEPGSGEVKVSLIGDSNLVKTQKAKYNFD